MLRLMVPASRRRLRWHRVRFIFEFVETESAMFWKKSVVTPDHRSQTWGPDPDSLRSESSSHKVFSRTASPLVRVPLYDKVRQTL